MGHNPTYVIILLLLPTVNREKQRNIRKESDKTHKNRDPKESRCMRYSFKSFAYPLPYCTQRDTRLRVAEEILARAMT